MGDAEIAGIWEEAKESPRSDGEKLDRALVAGMMLEVILEISGSPADPQARRRFVKARLKDTMVTQLAGRVTLDTANSPEVPQSPPPGPPKAPPRVEPPLPPRRALRDDLLQTWFKREARELLPRRPHRKLHPDKLWEFLHHTRGGWFRLKDFEQHFGVDRKTAWEYLQKLLQAGLLRHNQGRSAAVRYALGTGFLVVRAELLEPKIEAALSGLPKSLADQVCEWLIATGGEAFWDEEWHGRLEPMQGREVTARLNAAGLLEVAYQTGVNQQFRLPRRWLQA
ncbi:MAG: hypothetical protein WC443_05575 [Desulfobaccales bacterium]